VTLEINIESPFVAEVRRRGFRAEKWGLNGWPDRCILLGNQVHFWSELKALDGTLTPAQKIIIPRLIEMGEHVYVTRSLREAIEQLDREVRLHRGGSPLERDRRW